MATFELNGDLLKGSPRAGHEEKFEQRGKGPAAPLTPTEPVAAAANEEADAFDLRQESVISLKVYDSCRQQECLDGDELGPARSAYEQMLHGKHYHEGEIIDPPDHAASVTIDDLRIKKIMIVDKKQNTFKRGFWDIDLKYVFEYNLVFREASCTEIGVLRAVNVYNRRVTLFGSIGSDIVISTDLFSESGDESPALSCDPFVLTEAKAVALAAKLKYARQRHDRDDCHSPSPNEVIVTIGLFTIVKLYRIVTLLVESRGFGIPHQCVEYSPINVCDYFDNLPFPMDVFAPPQKREFDAGISGDIVRSSAETTGACMDADE